MHPIHQKCFIEFIGNNSSKKCLLCQRPINCILPSKNIKIESEEDEEAEEMWRNRIIYISIKDFNSYRVDETFIMLLKGLVTRNGLMEIFQPQTKDFQANTNALIF